jgi:NAD(P)-dependent dehydrogenase (short-subunit alcohol dehydrogenase family)
MERAGEWAGERTGDLAGKVALVTGAGSGIGRASALRLAAMGATVAALSRTASEVAATAEAIERAGGRALALTADVAEEAPMRAAIAAIIAAHGRLDIVVANAGVNGTWAPIDDLTPAEWDQTIAINLRGTYLTLHLSVPHLKAAGGGAVVIVASINGTRTFSTAGATAYAATKAAQVAMAQQLALELGRHRIRVNAVCPGEIVTAMPENTRKRNVDAARVPVIWPEGDIPITGGKPGRSEDVADVVAFLASDAARHVTGSPLFVDGGQSLLR